MLSAGEVGSSDADIVAYAPLYQLVGGSMKRQREAQEAAGESEGQQDEGAQMQKL